MTGPACATLPQLQTPLYGYDRTDLLLQQVFTGDAFLDVSAGQCKMENDAFAALLQDCAALPAQRADDGTDPKPLFTAGQALAYNLHFGSFEQLKTVRYVLDGPFDFTGLPTDVGSGRALSPGIQLGISTYCQQPQAAWDFLRTLWLPDFQQALATSFPARQDILARQAETATQPRPATEPPGVSYLPLYLQQAPLTEQQQAYWYGPVESEDAQKLLEVIQKTDTTYQFDSTIAAILLEEAEPFFNGQHTAEETAKIMQDRVQTYLDEQS